MGVPQKLDGLQWNPQILGYFFPELEIYVKGYRILEWLKGTKKVIYIYIYYILYIL